MTESTVQIGRTERLPKDGRLRCGSSCAHAACKFAGEIDQHLLLLCAASAKMWSACPYKASGYVNVYDGQSR